MLQTRRRYRRERLKEMRVFGIQATRRVRILGVRITAIPMPEWVEEKRIQGLSSSESFAWLRKRDARFLMALDYAAGGKPHCSETEFRRCPICSRPLIGEAAQMRRETEESCRTGRMIPCGADCIEAERDGRWR